MMLFLLRYGHSAVRWLSPISGQAAGGIVVILLCGLVAGVAAGGRDRTQTFRGPYVG